MQTRYLFHLAAALMSAVFISSTLAQGTAFTYQGQLTDGGQSANGVYELQFTLYDSSGGTTVVAGPLTFSTVTLTNGNFTAELDFGSGVFTGEARWLEIGVRTNGSPEDFTLLGPRQEIMPTPYALYAPNAGVATSADTATVATGTEPNAVDNASLQTDSVTTDKILDGTITAGKLDSTIGVWSRSGDTVYRPDGRVGIGTFEPSTLLHIHGSIATARGQLSLSAPPGEDVFLSFYEGDNFKAYLWYDDSDDDLRLQNYNEVNGGDLSLNPYGGNVGIGIISPESALHVAGTVKASSFSGDGSQLTDVTAISVPVSSIGTSEVADGSLTTADLDLASVDARYVNTTGDTMTGNLLVQGAVNLHDSSLTMYAGDGSISAELAGQYCGYLQFYTEDGNEKAAMGANESLAGWMYCRNAAGPKTILIWGDYMNSGRGRIQANELEVTGGSDLSEQFDILTAVEPGSVVCIDPENPGKLVVSSKAYDRTVAGVVSGAGGVRPGMMMGQSGTMADGGLPVALSGRVYCRVDASQGAIQPGDLLTTSDVPGHAMKATDHAQAQGAIIGKAMTSMAAGKGLVLVLVSLQ